MKRDLQSETVREAILEAARTLFLTHGYEDTTVRDICERAGITLGSLYHFFGNKEGVFAHLVHDLMETTAGLGAYVVGDEPPPVQLGFEMSLQIQLISDDLRVAGLYHAAYSSWPITKVILEVGAGSIRRLSASRGRGLGEEEAYALALFVKSLMSGITQERIGEDRLSVEQRLDLLLGALFPMLGLNRPQAERATARIRELIHTHRTTLRHLVPSVEPTPTAATAAWKARKRAQ
ncbi:MAG: TetR/AcrR family transcriptional regulator [Aquabacterium sp.]|nr:MAG: TetR/AcrR family transcriptional regulator [Aquabacterium sp.]